MAEWADDKIRVLESRNLKTIVLTGISSGCLNSKNTRYIKIPPLSWREFHFEKSQIQDHSISLRIRILLFTPIAFILGNIFDALTSKVITSQNPARWSWAFSSLPIATYFRIRHKIPRIFATGGALSGQLLGSLIWIRGKSKLYLEYQDPIVGNEIVRNDKNQKLMYKLENFLISRSNKSYFVTHAAMNSAVARHPSLRSKISFLYPGAWNFNPLEKRNKEVGHEATFIHVGTLYGTRNMDNLFKAIDNLKSSIQSSNRQIKIVNLGALHLENIDRYLERADFEKIVEVDRVEALNMATTADVLLLIQHTDNRSLETIPYKTYDYLNLGLPIFGITNNSELNELIESAGGVAASANSISSIQESLMSLFTDIGKFASPIRYPSPVIEVQFMKLLEIAPSQEREMAT